MPPLSTGFSIFCFINSKYFLPATPLLGQSSKIPLTESRLSPESLEGIVFWVVILSLSRFLCNMDAELAANSFDMGSTVAWPRGPPEEAMEAGKRLGKGVARRQRGPLRAKIR